MTARQFVIAVDFDHTIHDPSDRVAGYRMGRPFPGAQEALTRLHNLGAKIIVHTCRARSPHGVIDPDYSEYVSTVDHVAKWLDFFEVPYDEITALKPLADVYLDDKALPFLGDWVATERELSALYYSDERLEGRL